MKVWILVAVALLACFGFSHATFDYCGVDAFPASIPPIQEMSPDLRKEIKSVPMSLTFIRHGDRSTIIKECFPAYPTRDYTECPGSTAGFPNTLVDGPRRGMKYDFKIKPLENAQVLKGNCHLGQLTERGILMSYNNGLRVGSYMNKTYSAYNKKPFTPDVLKLRSTDVHRTRETAASFVTGLLDNMRATPASLANMSPIYFADSEVDSVKLNKNVCNIEPYLEEVYSSRDWLDYKKNVMEPLSQKAAMILKQDTAVINDIFDCGKINTCLGTQNPPGYETIAAEVEDVATEFWRYGFRYDFKRANRLFSGFLVTDILADLISISLNPNEDPVFILKSGHDFGPMFNLVNVLGLIKQYPAWPPYSAMVNFEVVHLKNFDLPHVRFLYQGNTVLPDFCDGQYYKDLCPIRTVINYLKEFVPTKEECPRIPVNPRVEDVRAQLALAEQRGFNQDLIKEFKSNPIFGFRSVSDHAIKAEVKSDVEMWMQAFDM